MSICSDSVMRLPFQDAAVARLCDYLSPAACHHDILLIQKDCAKQPCSIGRDARMTDDCF